MNKKMWQGRFEGENDPLMERFNRSLDIDARMAKEDIAGSIAWSKALYNAGILSKSEAFRLSASLTKLLNRSEDLPFEAADEDIHMAVERLLTYDLGGLGKKIHTGRSRNDQVALDTRLYMKKVCATTINTVADFMAAVLALAKKEKDTIMPAFTHLQAAQPVSMAHYFLSWFFMLERDCSRFCDCAKRMDIMPLASGALTGSGFAIDRELLRRELGFAKVTDNSIDAVSDRDYLIEFLSAASITAMHLSRFAEDIIIFCSPGYKFFELSDAYSTGSSMMPNKKNPDSMELVRGKSGRIFGSLVTLLTVTKGLPLAYNKDLQEDKAPVFDAAETLIALLKIFSAVLRTITVNHKKISDSLPSDMLATDLADMLVEKGLPFRDAHDVVGRIVLDCAKSNRSLISLSPKELKGYSKHFGDGVTLSFENGLMRRNLYGGTGPDSVKKQLQKAETVLKKLGNDK